MYIDKSDYTIGVPGRLSYYPLRIMKCHCIKFKHLAYCTEYISIKEAVIYKYLS